MTDNMHNDKSEPPTEKPGNDVFAVPALPASKQKPKTISPNEEGTTSDHNFLPPPPPVPKKPTQQQQPEPRNQKHPEAPPLNYEAPEWSSPPQAEYYFEILKNGSIIAKSGVIEKEFLVVGRLPMCDIELEHASVSRYHAIIQFKDDGTAYVYDLGSSHGTSLNKNPLPKRQYKKLRVGDMLRFGQSTRLFIFQGPEEPEQPEVVVKPIPSKPPTQIESSGVTWGFGEDATEDDTELPDDADEDTPDAPSNFSSLNPEETRDAYYYKDPKKALRTWFEIQGGEPEYEVEEEGHGRNREYVAKVELPIETSVGGVLHGIGRGSKKKDAEREAALDACIKLDKRGILRGGKDAVKEAEKKRLKELLGDDDDDGDSFYDRTATSERKTRRKGQKSAAASTGGSSTVETFDSLTKKKEDVLRDIAELQERIRVVEDEESKRASAAANKDGGDELDSYMQQLQSKIKTQSKDGLKRKIQVLEKELHRLDRLIKIATPHDVMGMFASPASKSKTTPKAEPKSSTPSPVQPKPPSSASSSPLFATPTSESPSKESPQKKSTEPVFAVPAIPAFKKPALPVDFKSKRKLDDEPPNVEKPRGPTKATDANVDQSVENNKKDGNTAEPDAEASSESKDDSSTAAPTVKRRRLVPRVMTAEEAEEHLKVETEEEVAGGWNSMGKEEEEKVKEINAAYGY
ncbi:Kanadaptin [Quaeritorhiza haematococci]|nr:Kanadaptin [Quaeritorhiza haematococci]